MTLCGKNKLRGTAAARHVSSLNRKPLESDAVKQSVGHVNCPLNAAAVRRRHVGERKHLQSLFCFLSPLSSAKTQ